MPSFPHIAHLAHGTWLTDGPLSDKLDIYIEWLEGRRYQHGTINAYLRCLAHFSHWMQTAQMSQANIDRDVIERFIEHHLPFRSKARDTRAALHHLLALLPSAGEADRSGTTPIDIEIKRFSDHLRNTCGLAPQTIFYRARHVAVFLAMRFGRDPPRICDLVSQDIEAFLATLADRWKPTSRSVICASLRSYFRYHAMLGNDTRQLCAALPTIANWPQRPPPKVLSEIQLDRFLHAFDASPIGLRDCAIAHLLVDMGLRGDEVAHLTLDAVDWRNGVVTLSGTKSQREQRLPLPTQTGEVLARYLQEGRPQTDGRIIFIRHRAPFGVPLSVAAIRNTMNRAFAHCGLAEQFCNTHVLRRTAATRMQKAGVSLKAIADVLRHQDLNTARVYARVDLERLRAVTLPWPGEES